MAVVTGSRSLKGRRYQVRRSGKTVLRGRLRSRSGNAAPWDKAFSADLSRLRQPGRYVLVTGSLRSRPWRVVRNASRQPIAQILRYFRANRDGNERSPIHGPSHLNDAVIHPRSPVAAGQRVSITGGWMDAGDMLHFTQTTAFATAMLEAAARLAPANRSELEAEADVGLRWLMAAHPSPAVFISQVGDERDHRLGFRDPAGDDSSELPGIGTRFAYTQRGGDLGGKASAALALGYLRTADPAMLAAARQWYAMGKAVKRPARPLERAGYPTYAADFYVAPNWKDSMAAGTAALFRASCAAGSCDRSYENEFMNWVSDARQTGPYAAMGAVDDFASFGEAEVCGAFGPVPIRGEGLTRTSPSGDFSRNVKRRACQLLRENGRIARRQALSNAFGMPGYFSWGTTAQNGAAGALAALSTAAPRGAKGGCRIAAGARDWLLGRNAFGASFVVGYGPHSPRNPHHWASVFGRGMPAGAVVGGPAPFSELHPLGFRIRGRTARFGSRSANYEDRRANYVTSEPGIDYAAASIVLLAALERHC